MDVYTLALSIVRLKTERRKLDEQIEALTDELRAALPRDNRIAADDVVAFWRRARVPDIQDLAAIPPSLFIREPDLKRIGALLRQGKTVPGTQLVCKETLFVYPPKDAASIKAQVGHG